MYIFLFIVENKLFLKRKIGLMVNKKLAEEISEFNNGIMLTTWAEWNYDGPMASYFTSQLEFITVLLCSFQCYECFEQR